MGVVYIGDRAAGKTHLALELSNPKTEYVKVTSQDYQTLQGMLMDEQGGTRPTNLQQPIYNRPLDVEVRLPTGNKSVSVDWIDTPGEVWRKSWQCDNQMEWQKILDTISKSEGIFLILPPHRGMTFNMGVNADEFMTQEQWCNRFDRWVDFFRYECPKLRHLVICLNKADLFCNLPQEAKQLSYSPNGTQMNWQQRHMHVVQRYFRPIQTQLQQINQSLNRVSVRCFITSIHNRSVLELPWIYMGSFLAKS
ncbi:hypothetical protein NWP22_12155 [Anabaenopsis tanganyikae CS-531]|uniref:Uncharacterized protein n=1 Tax=Anabaenopsis tanganyikae CS-531 TaxID=2785304 RepID=A0ABT6KFY3_9CYAN|nr:hypothetical protein [Anabaenopsis tanganyikae]MDH6106612.1 hypothetical protein [Anabaenopsis tanganyikae CS-531]